MNVDFVDEDDSKLFIVSTSGRVNSLKRYHILLNDLLNLNIEYKTYNSNNLKIDPQDFVKVINHPRCIGGAISKDIKATIVPFLSESVGYAINVRSVNTVIKSNNQLIGYNTDAEGFRIAISEGIGKAGLTIDQIKTAVCYGYGGVTNVVASVLTSLGFKVFITGRRPDEIIKRCSELSQFTSTPILPWNSNCDVDLFVNASPVTNQPLDQASNFLEAISRAKVVFDHELDGTYLINYCKENDKYFISGYGMYFPQMSIQWKLFLKSFLSEDQIEQLPILLKEAENRANGSS